MLGRLGAFAWVLIGAVQIGILPIVEYSFFVDVITKIGGKDREVDSNMPSFCLVNCLWGRCLNDQERRVYFGGKQKILDYLAIENLIAYVQNLD